MITSLLHAKTILSNGTDAEGLLISEHDSERDNRYVSCAISPSTVNLGGVH